MKRHILLTTILTALVGGFLVWNFDANTASAQKNESAEGVNLGVATEYNARNEFALTQGGTSGVWNYGFSNSATDNTFTQHTLTRTTSQCSGNNSFEEWYRTGEPFDLPSIRRNVGAAACMNAPPETLILHPSDSGRRAVLRWIAPASGTFQVNGVFNGLDNTTTDVKILKNAATAGEATLFSGNIVGFQAQQPFNFTVTAAMGDTIDFSVGYGTNSEENDSTGLAVTIGQPVTACLTAPANLQVFVPGENSTADVIGQNFNGSLVGDATYTNTGKVGRAFNFDGSGDMVKLDDKNNQDITGDLTIEAWINPTNVSGDKIIVDKRNFNNTFLNYGFYLTGGNLSFASTNGAGGFNVVIAPSATVQAGVYSHVAVVIAGTNLIFYQNGIEVHRAAYNFPRQASDGQLQIGGLNLSVFTGSFFQGQIDDISIYSRALAQTEIFDIVQQGSFGKCPPANCVQPPNNLVSWFAGEQNALDSRSNNHGTLQNGATFAVGKVGQAFNFNGSGQHVSAPDNPSLNSLTATWEFWLKTTQTGVRPGVVGKHWGFLSLNGINFFVDLDGKLKAFLNGSSQGSGSEVVTPTAVNDGTWHHVALTFVQGGAMFYYLDGQQVDTDVTPATFNFDPGSQLRIGRVEDSFWADFVGQVDELDIFNRALSATEISSIYNAGQSGKCKPMGLNPPTNQIAWFSGDGDARDFAGEDQNGTFAANNYAVGKVGQSFRFDGVDDFVAVADDNALDITGDVTLEAWINPTVYNTTIISKRDVNNSNITYVLFLESNGTLAFASRQNGVFVPTFTTTTTVPLNQFSHVAATIQGTTLRLYIDGIERGVSASYPTRTASDGRLTIGAFETNMVGGFYQGKIDEVSIYNRALSASEIAAVYNAGTAGKLKSATTPVNFARTEKTSASFAPTTVQLSSASVTFPQVTTAGTTSQSGLDLGLLPKLPSNVTTNNLNYDLSTTAAYTGNVTVCFNVPAIPSGSFTQTNILHLENGVWMNPLPNTTVRNYPQICGDFSSLSPFAVVQGLAPTAASVKLSGKVSAGKTGVSDAVVYLTDQTGSVRTTRANSFGYYEFADVEAGQTYVINAYSRRYQFPTQIVSLTEATTVNLTANE